MPEPDAETVFEDIKRGGAPSRGRDRGLTVRHLEQFFGPSIYSGFDDGDTVRIMCSCLLYLWTNLLNQSFFTIYRNLFARLAHEESQWSENPTDFYPQFGYSHWTWAPPTREDTSTAARTFYNYWLNFVTAKEFSWVDQWELNDAPDRRVRRLVWQTYLGPN